MMIYHTLQPNPPAALQVRIRKADGGDWLPVPLLSTAPGWAQVDDGAGPLWVSLSHIHRLDWPALNLLTRLQEARS